MNAYITYEDGRTEKYVASDITTQDGFFFFLDGNGLTKYILNQKFVVKVEIYR